MARISSYALDAKPQLGDKVLGTDTDPKAGLVTKNYSLREMIKMFNQKNAVAVAGQSVFRFQSDDLSLPQYVRETGTISFQHGLGVGTNFANIGQLYISIKNSELSLFGQINKIEGKERALVSNIEFLFQGLTSMEKSINVNAEELSINLIVPEGPVSLHFSTIGLDGTFTDSVSLSMRSKG